MGYSSGGNNQKNVDIFLEIFNKFRQNDENSGDIFDVCLDDICFCKDFKKFFKYFVVILVGDENFVFFYKCVFIGDVIMNEEMCLDKDGNNVGRMVVFDFEYVNIIMNIIDKEKFLFCFRFVLLCKKVCYNIYFLLIMSLCQGFVELQKKDDVKVEFYICFVCGNKEIKLGEFKRCGGCKIVYYCGRKC